MEPTPQELLDLLADTKNQLEHLRVLGIEGIRPPAGTAPAIAVERPKVVAPVRERPAPIKTPVATPSVAEPAVSETVGSESRSSLFGDITPPPVKLIPSTETFEQIHAEIGDCTRCPLHEGRTHVVHTEGNRKARLMFVGEAPGADEDAQARPFVGRAGQLLTKIIEAIGMKREEVLIGNVNRCRPPGNRAPMPDEAATCKPYLLREIAVVQPEVIVVLGNTAMKNLLGTREGITRLRGRFQDYNGIQVMPTFHPAYLLRDPSKKRETWEDLKKVRDYLDSSRVKTDQK